MSGNSAGTYGGGLSNTGTLTLTNSTVAGNFADTFGGGVLNFGALALTNSTVSGNSAAGGGGGVAGGGVMTLANSTVSGNSAGSDGGGVLSGGTLTLTNSTVSDNSAFDDGGGVFNSGGTLTLDQSLVSGNSAFSPGPEVFNSVFQTFPATVITNGFNLFGHDGSAGVYGFVPEVTDLVPTVPLSAILDPALAANGGATSTHALVIGSPAIDTVPAASCVTIGDQRGVTRPQDGDEDTLADCDIGAFELQPPPPPPPPPSTATSTATSTAPTRGDSRRSGSEGAMRRVQLSRPHQVRRGSGLYRAVQYPRRCLHPCQCLAARGRWRGQGAAAHQVRRRRH